MWFPLPAPSRTNVRKALPTSRDLQYAPPFPYSLYIPQPQPQQPTFAPASSKRFLFPRIWNGAEALRATRPPHPGGKVQAPSSSMVAVAALSSGLRKCHERPFLDMLSRRKTKTTGIVFVDSARGKAFLCVNLQSVCGRTSSHR